MKNLASPEKRTAVIVPLLFCLLLIFSVSQKTIDVQAQTESKEALRARALRLVDENLYIEALPLLEKIAPLYKDDVDVWTYYGIAILTHSTTLKDAATRKSERKRGREVLVRAQELGTRNAHALDLLASIPPDGGDEGEPVSKEADEALREGEGYFGRGQYDKAFAAYERAYNANPKMYEAALFAGDALYAQEKFDKANEWFAKAVVLNPDREEAYRYWGDSLMNQGKTKEARDKFIEAIIAEPYKEQPWNTFNNWVKVTNTLFLNPMLGPPGAEANSEIVINEKLLSEEDGTIHWKLYKGMREVWKKELFAKTYGANTPYRHTLREEAAAFRIVAEATLKDLKSGKIKELSLGLKNLLRIHEAGLIEAYILFARIDEDLTKDYFEYRKTNRDKLRRYFTEILIGINFK